MFPKIRAWVDTITGCYLDDNGKTVNIKQKFMENDITTINRKEKEGIGVKGIWFKFDDAIFMRSTSVKDKNGKEIYEKDIVKDENGYIYIVEFTVSDNFCGFQMIPIKCKPKYPSENILWKSNNIEIIGNVFENDEYKYYRKGKRVRQRTQNTWMQI